MMKTLTLFTGLFLAMLHPIMAQLDMEGPTDDRREQIKAQKVAFLTQRLELTSDEAQRFWPLHNEFEEEIHANRANKREQRKVIGARKDDMTEEQARKLIDLEMAFKQKELDIRRNYNERFIASIGAVRTARLYHAEREFHKELLKRFRERGPRGEGERRQAKP